MYAKFRIKPYSKTVPLFTFYDYRMVSCSRTPGVRYRTVPAASSPWGKNPCRVAVHVMVFLFSRFGFWSGLGVLRHCAKKRQAKKKPIPAWDFLSYFFFFVGICAAPHAPDSLVRDSRSRAGLDSTYHKEKTKLREG